MNYQTPSLKINTPTGQLRKVGPNPGFLHTYYSHAANRANKAGVASERWNNIHVTWDFTNS